MSRDLRRARRDRAIARNARVQGFRHASSSVFEAHLPRDARPLETFAPRDEGRAGIGYGRSRSRIDRSDAHRDYYGVRPIVPADRAIERDLAAA